MGWASLSRPVDKIPRFTEMGGFQSGVFTLFPYRDQLLTRESHHVNPVSPRCRTKGNPTDMYRCREIYPILMFCPPFFYDHTVNQGFRDIISDQPRPHLLLDKLRLLGMKITQPHGIFQLPERALHAPPGPIKFFQTLQGELVPRKVGDDTLIRVIGQGKARDPEGKRVSARGAILNKIKRGLLIHKPAVTALPHLDLP